MSDEHKDLYYHVPYDEDDHHPPSGSLAYTSFDPSAYMSFTDCLQHGTMDNNTLTKAYGLFPSSEVVSTIEVNPNKPIDGGDFSGGGGGSNNSEIPATTPNSSASFSSGEAGGDQADSGKSSEIDRQQKGSDDSRECSKKGNKEKRKGEKKQREARFAFMTKTEVDHLEDGYRWRKYGQKAVKNSPYPRSYYRCTTQKCTVKKRVERSFQDPSVVITTYEGQHNHLIPTTLRGNAAALFSHSLLTPAPIAARPGQDFLISSMNNQLVGGGGGGGASSLFPQNINYQHSHGHYQVPDYGLLQDLIPSMFSKQEP